MSESEPGRVARRVSDDTRCARCKKRFDRHSATERLCPTRWNTHLFTEYRFVSPYKLAEARHAK
jgi:hypothetical protein